MNDMKQSLFELDVYGFTIVEDVLSIDEVFAMKAALIRLCEQDEEDRGDCLHVSNLLVKDPIFFKVIDHPAVLPLLEAYMGHIRKLPLIIGSLNARIVRPGDPAQRMHGDVLDDLMKMDGKTR